MAAPYEVEMATLLRSVGYEGTIMPNQDWAKWQWSAGARYMVYNNDTLVARPVSDGTREIEFVGGVIGGWGIQDELGNGGRVQLPLVETGTEWFLVSARRTWGTSQRTTFSVTPAGSSPILPTRQTSPGEVDDQPLCLVAMTAGQSVPGEIRDLRVIGTGGTFFLANDELALSYMGFDGITIRIGDTVWQRKITSTGARTWDKQPGVTGRIALPSFTQEAVIHTDYSGWTAGGQRNTAIPYGNTIQLDLQVVKKNATLKVSPTAGGVNDTEGYIGTIDPRWTPPLDIPLDGIYYLPDGSGSYGCTVRLRSNGDLAVIAAAPSIDMPVGTQVVAHAVFIRPDAS